MITKIITPRIVSDLLEISEQSTDDFELIGNHNLVITGASGFVGTWLTLSYLHLQRRMELSGHLHLIARNPVSLARILDEAGFEGKFSCSALDVRNITPMDIPVESLIIHAATPAQATLNAQQPLEMLDIIIGGQRAILDAAAARNVERVLFLSSGAIYGSLPLELHAVHEEWNGAPLVSDPLNAYHEGKRIAELIGNIVASEGKIDFVTARLFAFLAPFLPMDQHFAAGNFLRDAHQSARISIRSGGGSVRSYQYATDMVSWIWALLARGRDQMAYNVGSEEVVTISELAETISMASRTKPPVEILGVDTERTVSRYVPDVTLINRELGLRNKVPLRHAIQRTLQWMDEQ